MSIVNSKKLKARILRGYAVPIGVLVVFGGSMFIVSQMTQKLLLRTEDAYHVMGALRESTLGAATMVRSARGAALFPDNPAYLKGIETGIEELETNIPIAEKLIQDPVQLQNWQEYKTHLIELEDEIKNIALLIQQNKTQQAINKLSSLEMSKLDREGREVINYEQQLLIDLETRLNRLSALNVWLSIIGIFLGTLSSLFLANLVAEAIIREVREAVTQISSSSSEIATTMEQQERTASLQAASVNETTTTMDELRASSHQSEEQARCASQAAEEVLNLAEDGNHSVEETVATMVDLKNKVAAISEQIIRLSEQTNQIGNISDLVSDLAQQTNMLALNASVEAVRAGEHGRGFSVVAEKIGKLADQSRQSASNINELVADIQNAINTTVMVTDEGTKTVNAGMTTTESTANAFAGVLDAIGNVAMNNQQIVLNIRQQGKAVEQVLSAMDSINKGAQETAAGLTQVKSGAAQLSHTAHNLEALV